MLKVIDVSAKVGFLSFFRSGIFGRCAAFVPSFLPELSFRRDFEPV